MSWGEVKKINSDFANEPLNFNNYINDISTFKENSYVLDEQNQGLWRSLIAQSLTLFGHQAIHETVYNRLTDADVDYMIRNNGRLGQTFNSFYRTSSFSFGVINDVLKVLTTSSYNELELKIQRGINRYVSEMTSDTSAGPWLAELFGVSALNNKTDIASIIGDSDLWANTIEPNESLRFVICISAAAINWFSSNNSSAFLSFITEVANSTQATMDLFDAIGTSDKLTTFMSAENVISIMANKKESMTAICYMIDPFAAMISSEIAMNIVAASETAISVIIDGITNATNSESVLGEIKGNLMSIEESLLSIANTEPNIDEVVDVKAHITDVVTSLQTVTSQTDILVNNIDALLSSEIAMTAIITNETAMTVIAANETVMTAIITNETLLAFIASNENLCIAIDPVINNYASIVVNTLENSSAFTKSSTSAIQQNSDLYIGSNTIIIPTSCDGAYRYTISAYSGVNIERLVVTANPYGHTLLKPSVSLRGVYYRMDKDNGAMYFDVYEVK